MGTTQTWGDRPAEQVCAGWLVQVGAGQYEHDPTTETDQAAQCKKVPISGYEAPVQTCEHPREYSGKKNWNFGNMEQLFFIKVQRSFVHMLLNTHVHIKGVDIEC